MQLGISWENRTGQANRTTHEFVIITIAIAKFLYALKHI